MSPSNFEDTIDPQTLTPPQTSSTRSPYVEVLYHADLTRVGLRTLPEVFASPNTPVVFGRTEPAFAHPAQHATPQSLDDPCVSRQQLWIAWLPELMAFEVKTSDKARRPCGVVQWPAPDASQDEIFVKGIQQKCLVKPGTCLAVGDRLLLWLDIATSTATGPDMGMVGQSEALCQIRREVARVASFQSPVLVQGETGTGKELVARAVCAHSARPNNKLKIVNCAALPETLVESLLFGHQKGSFTGAGANTEGVFPGADGGTLFWMRSVSCP